MNQVTLSLLIFNLNKDSLHFLTNFEVIRILLGTVFRTLELVHFDQITIIGVDPLFGSDLPVVLDLDMYPFIGWTFFSE